MTDVPTSPRTLADRIPTVTLDGDTRLHAARGSNSPYVDIETVCGLRSERHLHDSNGSLPVADLTCAACVTGALAIPLEHRTSSGRVSRGRSPIASRNGGGRYYGTAVHCACGVRVQFNVAPSQGGNASVRAWEREHFAQVEAANAAALEPATAVVVHEFEGNTFEARLPVAEAQHRLVTLAEEGIEARLAE